jgi:hypothetical protein
LAERCTVCGQEIAGLTHTCPGSLPLVDVAADEWAAPKGFALGYYLRMAIGIARFEDAPILAASRDEDALAYGALFWSVTRLAAYTAILYPQFSRMAARTGDPIKLPVLVLSVLFFLILDAAWVLCQYGICHALARWWFGGRGTYVGILRAMLLGSIVFLTVIIPVAGPVIAGLWLIAILMRVFEEVDGIERMKAFGLAFATGMIFFVLSMMLLTPKR